MTTAVYARISSDPKDRRIGVDRQVHLCSELAVQRWPDSPVTTYVDNSLSGATAERPRYIALLADLRAGRVEHLVVYEQSRLTRDPSEWESLTITLARAGVDVVHTIARGDVTVTEGNRLIGRIFAAVDAEELERIRARIRVSQAELLRLGRPAGVAAYGYTNSRDADGKANLAIDPVTGPVVKEIFERFLDGEGFLSITRWLIDSETPTARGGRIWWQSSVRSILTNPVAAGYRTHGREITGPGTWPALIDPAMWSEVQARITGVRTYVGTDGVVRRIGKYRRRAGKRLLGGGILRCSQCGTALSGGFQGRRDGDKRPAYTCARTASYGGCGKVNMTGAPVDDYVTALVLEALEQEQVRRRLVPVVDEAHGQLIGELAETEALLVDLGRALGAGEMDRLSFGGAHDAARRRAEILRRRIDDIAARPVIVDPDTVAERWPDLDLDRRRDIIRALIDTIVVDQARPGTKAFDPDRLRISWRF